MNKYHNTPVEFDGYRFDSKAEGRRYKELAVLKYDGQIHGLTVHPVYELLPAFTDSTGKRIGAIRYEADFEYIEDGRLIVEDVKGVETDVFKLKAKLFRHQYPGHVLRIVKA